MIHNHRNTYVTDELRFGETDIKTIAEIVGHSNTGTTLNIYADTMKEMKCAAARRRQESYDSQKNV